jgi:hypothetical protein
VRAPDVKRRRGRPSGSTKLPAACLLDVLRIVDEQRARTGLSIKATCESICKKGGLEWGDETRVSMITKIDNPDTLRVRYYEAKRAHRLDEGKRRLVYTVVVYSHAPGRKMRRERRHRFVFAPRT